MEVEEGGKVAKCRVCGVELTDENWYPSLRDRGFICKDCVHRRYIEHKEQHKEYMHRYYEIHKQEIKENGVKYRRDNKEKIKKFKKIGWYKSKYGLNKEEYENLLKRQDNKCAICGKEFNESNVPHVDHDHKTGKIRGFLCNNCNTGIGMLCEDPKLFDKAKEYILKHREIDNGNTK